MESKNNNGLGVGFTLILWGMCFFLFPRITGLTSIDYLVAVTWIFYIFGFMLSLIGIMGTCLEVFKNK